MRMAGMLPGVLSARRRRLQHGASDHSTSWVRMSSSRHELSPVTYCASTSSNLVRSACYVQEQQMHDEKLGGIAREAKERLDEKLRNQRDKALRHPKVVKNEEVTAIKRSVSKSLKLGWTTKLRWNWKTSEQVECSICLERFKLCESLALLPCAHRFHSKCLVPWIESNAHCPCCRMSLSS